METKGFFRFETIINVLVRSFWFIWLPMVLVYGHFKYVSSYRARIDFRRQNLTSGRQILTPKVNPRTVRVNHQSRDAYILTGVKQIRFWTSCYALLNYSKFFSQYQKKVYEKNACHLVRYETIADSDYKEIPRAERIKHLIISVGAGRSPRRQMRRYLPCGERFVMSLATVAKKKTRCFHNTYESWAVFAVKIAAKTTALQSFFLT